MSEIKAIEKLRKCADHESAGFFANLEQAFGLSRYKCGNSTVKPNSWMILNAIADEIEAEISERYIKLPTDKNGNVIHVGDMVKHADGGVYEVVGVDNDGARQGVFINTGDGRYPIDSWCASGMELYKPRTLEDVLRDVWKEALDYAKSDMWRNPDEVFAERADEIRELLGGDAE